MSRSVDELVVGLVQARLFWQEAEPNRNHLAELMDSAPGCHLYLLPETFSTGFLGDQGRPAETLDGPTLAWMKAQSLERGAAIAGSLALDVDGQRRNRFVFVDEGKIVAHYDKRHLFAFGGEDKRYVAGQDFCTFDWRGWRIDLQICYDLRFPAWCRNRREFDLQLFVANWPSPRVLAWQRLLQARAIENQAAVVGVNRVGEDGKGIDYPGASSAWDALGACLIEIGRGEGVGRVALDRSAIRSVRETLPFLADADDFRISSIDDE
ncbi:MAG: nitrilase-related carbon-nitrogen hydrolase [Wenzhouxiangella sp.]